MNVEPWREFQQGASGDTVRALQRLLRAHGSSLAADGVFGATTETAVRDFQAANGLPGNGIVEAITWAALVVATGPGSAGEAVSAVQEFGLVIIPGDDPLVVDGVYGGETESRVRSFQGQWGLESDGVAGRSTWSYLGADKRVVWPLVQLGAANYLVRPVQHLLRARGYGIAVDGSYGPETAEAVRQFAMSQRAVHVDSVVGNLTWPELVIQVSQGDAGDAVQAVQLLLPGLTVDGVFGSLTEAAVTQFQTQWGLMPDGIVGQLTWHMFVVPKFD